MVHLIPLVLIGFFVPSQGWTWGERGHHALTVSAARTLRTLIDRDHPEERAFASFMAHRHLHLGYLSNVPDTLWKDGQNLPRVAKANYANHYFNPEHILKDVKGLISLTTDYESIKQRYQGKKGLTPGFPTPLDVYDHLGTAPWRSQQLYQTMVDLLACAASKGDQKPRGTYPPVRIGYQCSKGTSRVQDLTGFLVVAGLLSHFIGDLAQPYHGTVDYDGWATGNGGIHVFFESLVVQEMGDQLEWLITKKAQERRFQQGLWKRINTDLTQKDGVVRLTYNLVLEGHRVRPNLVELDKRFGLLKGQKSQVLPLGDHPRFHKEKVKRAVRQPPQQVLLQNNLRPMVVDRLGVGAFVLAKVWLEAYRQAGRPKLSDINAVHLPFPHTPPFLWPNYEKGVGP